MTESTRSALSAARELPELLWLLAEHEVDVMDAVPITPLLQQALDHGLVHWPSSAEGVFRLALTPKGRQRIGLPVASQATEGAQWLGEMGRQAYWRF